MYFFSNFNEEKIFLSSFNNLSGLLPAFIFNYAIAIGNLGSNCLRVNILTPFSYFALYPALGIVLHNHYII